MQDVVDVSASNPCHRTLISQQRVEATAVSAIHDELGERRLVRLWTKAGQRTVVARRKNPPTGLSLIAVLTNEDTDAVVEDETNHTPSGFRRLRRFLESPSRPPERGGTRTRQPPSISRTTYLARRVTPTTTAPSSSAGLGRTVFSPVNPSWSTRSSRVPTTTAAQALVIATPASLEVRAWQRSPSSDTRSS